MYISSNTTLQKLKGLDKRLETKWPKTSSEKEERVILHIDYDSFFASVEQQINPFLRNKPVGVTGSSLSRGVICASSIQAKKLGVKTGMPVFKARQLCPEILLVKGDFTAYQHIHEKSLEIFNKYTDLVEAFSIDEAFLDVTKTIKFFGSAQNIARSIKNDICRLFGPYVTCSIGIGPNKLLAKLVSHFNKPNGLFEVNNQNLKEVLNSVQLTDFCGIGGRIDLRLKNLGITTVQQLQKVDPELLYKAFGNVESQFLKNLSFGIDNSQVQSIDHEREPKSIGHQHTLSKNTKDVQVIKNNLRRLSEMTAHRLRRNKMMGKTISIYIRDMDFKGYHQRHTLTRYTENGQKIFETAEMIYDSWNWKNKEVRLVGVTISNLRQKEQTVYPLFSQDQIEEKIIKAADIVNNKFGEFTLVPANTLLADKTKGKISSFLRHQISLNIKDPLGSNTIFQNLFYISLYQLISFHSVFKRNSGNVCL